MEEYEGDLHNHSMVVGYTPGCPRCMSKRIAYLESELCKLTEERDAEVKRRAIAEAALAELTDANHSVRVCAKHTVEIANGGGCAICDVEEANERADRAESDLAAAREENIALKIAVASSAKRLLEQKAELASLRARDEGQPKPHCGWAPGHYSNKCCVCGEMFDNCDKRAVTCRKCADVELERGRVELVRDVFRWLREEYSPLWMGWRNYIEDREAEYINRLAAADGEVKP